MDAINQFVTELDRSEYCLMMAFVAGVIFWVTARACGMRRNAPMRVVTVAVMLAVAAAFSLRVLLLEAYVIPTPSMEPALAVGDRVLGFKAAYGWHLPFIPGRAFCWSAPKAGDLAIFTPPGKYWLNYVKRIAAVEGEAVELRQGRLYVDGAPRLFGDEAPPASPLPCGQAEPGIHLEGQNRDCFGPLTVPKDCVFVLGDNRNHSEDSRYFGPLPLERLRGRAVYRYLPAGRRGGL